MKMRFFMVAMFFCMPVSAADPIKAALGRLPQSPLGPTNKEECERYIRPHRALADQASKEHQECLDSSTSQESYGDCSEAPCQPLHELAFGEWKRAAERRYQACIEEVREVRRREDERKRAEERAREQYAREVEDRTRAAGEAQRERDRQIAEQHTREMEEERRENEARAEKADRQAGVFSGAISRNLRRLSAALSRDSGGQRPLDSVLGGSLSQTAAELQAESGSSPVGWGDSVDLGAAISERVALVADAMDWRSKSRWDVADSVFSGGSSILGYMDTLNAVRKGDRLAMLDSAASTASEFALPPYAAFFSVPAMSTTIGVVGAGMQELDMAFASSYGPDSELYVPQFQSVQRAIVDGLCPFCKWVEAGQHWVDRTGQFLMNDDASKNVSMGWQSVTDAM
jgi:hypothetical protein